MDSQVANTKPEVTEKVKFYGYRALELDEVLLSSLKTLDVVEQHWLKLHGHQRQYHWTDSSGIVVLLFFKSGTGGCVTAICESPSSVLLVELV